MPTRLATCSLTLLLPSNRNGAPYELWVNERGPVKFDVGLQPVTEGHPEDVPLPVNASIPGTPEITVRLALRPPVFPNQKQWDEDQKALLNSLVQRSARIDLEGTRRYLGTAVPRSPAVPGC